MSDRKVVPFRGRPPPQAELETYKLMTRTWHADARRRIFPVHFHTVEQQSEEQVSRPAARLDLP